MNVRAALPPADSTHVHLTGEQPFARPRRALIHRHPQGIVPPMAISPVWWRPDARRGPAAPIPHAVLDFHRCLPGYAPTPLVELPDVAARLQVGRVLVKDESDRFGLPAFKMLGASWAAAQAIRHRKGAEVWLLTATAGNHGRAVARAARLFGVPAGVWMPATTPAHLRAAIEAEGAATVVVDGDYDDAVRQARDAAAADEHAVLVQDTAHDDEGPGGDLPARVVEGYATLFHEIRVDLGREPDVLVVPVGVGSLALAAATYTGAAILTVEPASAACLLTNLAGGERRPIRTGPTVMAGLNAGTVSAAGWPVLRERVAAAVAVTDEAAVAAARDLHDAGIAAGPCGGAALAGLGDALAVPAVRAALGLRPDACVVVLSTDGAS
jgi:diaminopropionate ammonia-lyase